MLGRYEAGADDLGGKPNREFWKKIFADGVSPTGIQVLARGLDLKTLVTPKGVNA